LEDQRLDALAAAYGAALVDPDVEADVRSRLRDSITASVEPGRIYPMRSPWWLLPFTLCLGGEWWLRRRSGLS
jgi:hypothetical protein